MMKCLKCEKGIRGCKCEKPDFTNELLRPRWVETKKEIIRFLEMPDCPPDWNISIDITTKMGNRSQYTNKK